MLNILKIFWGDLKKISRNAIAWIVVLGLSVVPALYAWFNIAANKVPGVIAAVCSEPYSAKLTKQHNNANIIAFGARVVGVELAKMILDEFFAAEFEGGRHQRRVDMIREIENR